MNHSSGRGQNRLLILVIGILLVAAAFYTASIGAIKPNPQYNQWLVEKQRTDPGAGDVSGKTGLVPNDRPPRTRYKISSFDMALILITLPIGVILILGSFKPGLINELPGQVRQ